MAGAGGADPIRIWNVKFGAIVRKIEGFTAMPNSAVFSPDGKTIVTAHGYGEGDYTVRMWNAETGKAIQTLAWHGHNVLSAAISPDGSRIVSGGAYGEDTHLGRRRWKYAAIVRRQRGADRLGCLFSKRKDFRQPRTRRDGSSLG